MSIKTAIDEALQANKEHQHALKAYIERMEKELQTVDKMIEDVDTDDDEDLAQYDSHVYVEGAKKPVSMVLPRTLLTDNSPFFEDARWKKRYDEFTTVSQMKAKEHDALREAVRSENMRMQMLESQKRNQPIDIKAFPPDHFEQNTEGIDWRRVSVKVNSQFPSSSPRTPRECEIRWLGHLHPSINNGPWGPEETQRLKDILAEDGYEKCPRDWVDIARKLGTNRTPIDCMRHGMTRRIHTWTPESDKRLLEAVELYGQNNWQLVAMTVSEDATAHQCQKRYLDSLDPSIRNGPWTPEEEERLRHAIAAFAGESALSGEPNTAKKQSIPWPEVALFVPGRTNNQCREHYFAMTKTKRVQRKKGSSRSAKGKEKAMTPNVMDDEDKVDDLAEPSAVEEEDTAQTNKGGPKAQARAGTKRSRKNKNTSGESSRHTAGPGTALAPSKPDKATSSAPKPKPRMAPWARARTRGSSPSVASPEPSSAEHGAEAGLHVQPRPGELPSSTPGDTSAKANPISIECRRRGSKRGKRGKKVAEAEADRERAEDIQSSAEVSDTAQQVTSAPLESATKRRKTDPSLRKGAGGNAESISSPRQNQTTDADKVSKSSVGAISDPTENKDLRRSSRLAKAAR